MSSEQAAGHVVKALASQESSHTPLRQGWLALARTGWVSATALILVAFATLLPPYFAQLHTPCSGTTCLFQPLSLRDVSALNASGLSVGTYALFIFALTLATALVCVMVGAIIFWRRSNDWIAILVSLVLIALSTTYVSYDLQLSGSTWQVVALVLNLFTFGLVFLAFSLFPDGRFVPGWSRWIAVGWSIWSITFLFFREVPLAQLAHNLLWLGFMASMVVVQAYRYRHVSDAILRQQTKWVVYGVSVTVIDVIVLKAPAFILLLLGQHNTLYDLVSGPSFILNLLLFPLCVSIAILRYRLYDIDVLINRTLVYGLLTAALLLIYFVLVVAGQALVAKVVGQNNDVVLVVSTLIVAALFQPLRRRVQMGVDRRFYRSKYDATQIMARLSVTLRQQVDLDELNAQVLTIVQETLQPASLSLWIRSRQHDELPQQPWRNRPTV
jgi:hypothetical protein